MLSPLREHTIKALRWSEKYTKTDMVYLASGGSWLAYGQVINSATTFLLALAFANLLPKEVYGTYRYVLSIAAIMSVFTLPGVNTSLLRAVAQGRDSALHVATRVRIRFALIGSCCAVLASLYYWFAGNTGLAASLVIVGAFLPVFDTFSTLLFYLQGKRDFRQITFVNNVINVGTLLVVGGTLIATHDLLWILFAYFGSYSALRGFFYFKNATPPKDNDGDRTLVRYGMHLSALNILGLIAENIDKILLFHYLGAEKVALYSIATALPDQAKSAIGMLDMLVFPKLASRAESVVKKSVMEKLPWFFVFGLAIVMVYILMAPLVFKLLFPSYVSVIFLSQIFAISMLNSSTFAPIASFLSAHGKVRSQYWTNTLTNIFQITIMVIMIKMAGLTGLIVARVLSRFFGGFINWIFFAYYRE